MSALPILPGGGAAGPVAPSTAVAPTIANRAAAVFAGVLDSVLDPRGATAALAGAAKRKGAAGATATDGATGGKDATLDPAVKGDGGASPQAQPTVDISVLAQSAALAAGIAPATAVAAAPAAPAAPSTSPGRGVVATATPASAAGASTAADPGAASQTAAVPQPAAGQPSWPGTTATAPTPDRSTGTSQSAGAASLPANASASPAPSTQPTSGENRAAPAGSAPAPTGVAAPAKAAARTAPAGDRAQGSTTAGKVDRGQTGASVVGVRPQPDGRSADRDSTTGDGADRSGKPSFGRSETAGENSAPTASPTDAGSPIASPANVVATAAPDPVASLLTALGTPAQQVTGAIQTLVAETRAAAAASAPAAAGATVSTNAASGAVKTLTLELSPEHLGPVSITLRLQADAMDIRIAVSTPQALHQLEQDKHVLSAAVAALGGTAASLHFGTNPDGAASGQPQQQAAYDRSSSLPSDTASTGRNAQGQGRPNDPSERNDPDDTTVAPIPTSRASDGSLYL